MSTPSNVPHIDFLIDPEKDIGRFNYFLNSTQYRRKRSSILSFYPKLNEQIEKQGNESEAVHEVVLDMYRRFHERIPEIVADVKNEFSKSAPVFDALARYMDVARLGEHFYTAVPTFLPFSPLDDDLFYFSIASDITERSSKPFRIVAIGVHEISHFLFYEQLAAWSRQNYTTLHDASIKYFKEALAAAIMDQPEFRGFFDYPELFNSETYRGNPELHEFSIEHDGMVENIVTYFKKEILQSSDGYRTSMSRVLKAFANSSQEFDEKWDLWNQTPDDPDTQNEFTKKYSEPIRLT